MKFPHSLSTKHFINYDSSISEFPGKSAELRNIHSTSQDSAYYSAKLQGKQSVRESAALKISVNRLGEIDMIRGIAIILMVIFHFIVDLNDFFGYNLPYHTGYWYLEGKASAILFVLIAGVSSTLGGRHVRRGAKIFAWGLVISAVTYIFNSETYVRFGILHLLGASIALYPLIKPWPPLALAAGGLLAVLAGNWTATLPATTALLLPLGVTFAGFVSMDYYPLLPWSGIFMWGTGLGKWLYKDRQPRLPKLPGHTPVTWLGRHSLVIYLVHQPILLALLYLLHLQ